MNVFENITKEEFIERYNNAQLNDNLVRVSRELAFELEGKNLKSEYKRSKITDILNYDTEIEVFNSFDIFKEYNGQAIIICDNLNNYYSYRKINKEVDINNFYPGYPLRKSINAFNAYVKKEGKIKLSYEFKVKLLNELIKPFINSFDEIFKSKLSFLDFSYNVKTNYTIKLIEFEILSKEHKLTSKHLLENNFLECFELSVISNNEYLINDNKTKLEYYVTYQNEFYDCILETADYLNYEVYGVNSYIFKKIKT